MFTPKKPNRSQTCFWISRREASLNWLALGMLLAAWNSADTEPSSVSKRPEALRGYSHVSVRAIGRAGETSSER
jgi:hypothetical protein